MSTPNEREAALRRALLAAAEQVEPAGDGLQLIQARLRTPRPLAIAWLEGLWTDLAARLPGVVQTAFAAVASGLRFAWDRFTPASAPGEKARPASWLRPLAAMTVAVFVVATGAYVALSGSALNGSPSSHFGNGTNGGGGAGGGSSSSRSGGTGGGVQGTGTPGPGSSSPAGIVTNGPGCSASPSISSFKAPSSTPSVSVSTSSSPSTSPTPTPTTSSPSPTSTTSSAPTGPGTSEAPAGNSSSAATTAAGSAGNGSDVSAAQNDAAANSTAAAAATASNCPSPSSGTSKHGQHKPGQQATPEVSGKIG